MIYALNYDLKQPGRDDVGLYGAIRACGAWWHYLESCWLLDTNLDADAIFNRIRPHLDKNDRALVFRIGSDRQGWLPEGAWDWINCRLALV